jgi:hypothetical protein
VTEKLCSKKESIFAEFFLHPAKEGKEKNCEKLFQNWEEISLIGKQNFYYQSIKKRS